MTNKKDTFFFSPEDLFIGIVANERKHSLFQSKLQYNKLAEKGGKSKVSISFHIYCPFSQTLIYRNFLICSNKKDHGNLAQWPILWEKLAPQQLVVLKCPDFQLKPATLQNFNLSYDTLALQITLEYFCSGSSASHKISPWAKSLTMGIKAFEKYDKYHD